MMKPYGGDAPENRTYGTPRPKDEVKLEAIEFLTQYYTSIKRYASIYILLVRNFVSREINAALDVKICSKKLNN